MDSVADPDLLLLLKLSLHSNLTTLPKRRAEGGLVEIGQILGNNIFVRMKY